MSLTYWLAYFKDKSGINDMACKPRAALLDIALLDVAMPKMNGIGAVLQFGV